MTIRLGPQSGTIFAPFATGMGMVALVRATVSTIGPSPGHLLGIIGCAALATVASDAFIRTTTARLRPLCLLFPLLFLVLLDPLLAFWGRQAPILGLELETGIWVVFLLLSLSLVPWLGAWSEWCDHRSPAGPPALSIGLLAGFALPIDWGLSAGIALQAIVVIGSHRNIRPPGTQKWRVGRFPAIAVATVATGVLWLATRTSTDPTIAGGVVFFAMLTLSCAAGQIWSPKSDSKALGAAIVWAMGALLLKRLHGTWVGDWVILAVDNSGSIADARIGEVFVGVADNPEAFALHLAIWSLPAILGLISGIAMGIALGGPTVPTKGKAAGIVIGLLCIGSLQHEASLLVTLSIGGAAIFFFANRPLTQASGLVLALGVWGTSLILPQHVSALVPRSLAPTLDLLARATDENQTEAMASERGNAPEDGTTNWMRELVRGQFRLLSGGDDLHVDSAWRSDRIPAYWGVGLVGGASTWVSTEAWNPDIENDDSIVVEQEGLLSWTRGREAKAEFMAGFVGAALLPPNGRSLILGDPTGRALLGFKSNLPAEAPATLTIALPQTGPLASIRDFDPVYEAALSPMDNIVRAHPEYVLRTQSSLNLVVEVVRAPWQDGTGLSPTAEHLDALVDRLGATGVLASVVHLRWFEQGQPEHIARLLAERFSNIQIWLPPEGADSLIFLASQTAFDLSRFDAAIADDAEGLAMMGMPDTLSLAAHAIGDHQTAREWGENGTHLQPDRFNDRVFSEFRPHWHTLGLIQFLRPTESTWATTESTEQSGQAASLAIYTDTLSIFLSNLLAEASGDPAASHLLSQQLDARDDPLAGRKLAELIDRHIELAAARISEAIATGEPSAWTDAHALAESARRRAPSEIEPVLLLGEILLEQSQLTSARENFQQALVLDETSPRAHWGLARVARARHDHETTEHHILEAVHYRPREWIWWHQLGTFYLEQSVARGQPRLEEAVDAFNRAVALSDGEDPLPYRGSAEVQLEMGRADQALVTINRAIYLGGGAYALYLRGRAYMALEQFDRAEADLRGAILADPDLFMARAGLGMIRAEQGDYAAAAEAFRAVLRVDPTNATALENLRIAEERLRNGRPIEGP